jgi:hypothetical protein
MDALAEIDAGMSWRRFSTLLAGLSPDAIYRLMQRSARRVQHVTGKDAEALFASLGPKRKTEVDGGRRDGS